MALTEGQQFAEYRIIRKLGKGGMGEVYLAQHPRLPRRDALKVLPADLATDESFRRRFIREADLAAGVEHPNVVNVYDRGEYNGQLWIAMRYIDGHDAAEELTSHPHGLAAEDVIQIVSAIADALDHAHELNLLHRDVKPANILLTTASGSKARRRVLLADFGIARPMMGESRLTATNLTVGSFAYSSPEQLMGQDLDGRADQYSLACTAYQLLGGSTPFVNSNAAAIIHQHMANTVPPITNLRPDLPSQIDAVLTRALEKEPQRRFPTCSDFASALEAALRSSGADITVAAPARPRGFSPGGGNGPSHPSHPSHPSQPSYPGFGPQPNLGKSFPGGTSDAQGHRPPTPAPGPTVAPSTSNPQFDPTAYGPQPGAGSAASGPYQPSAYAPGGAPYQQPGYRPAPPALAENNAKWSLITSLLAIPGGILCGLPGVVLAVVAIVLGIKGLRRSPHNPVNPGTINGGAVAGIIIGVLALVWSAFFLIAIVVGIVQA